MNKQSTIRNTNPVLTMLKSNVGIIIVMLIIMIGLTFLTPNFMTFNNVISVLRQISNNVYLALGMTLVIILGGIDLSVGSIVAMSGTITVGLMVNNNMPIPAAILIGLVLGALVGFVNGGIVAMFNVPAFIVTLATMNIAKGIAYIYTGGQSTRITDDAFAMLGTGYLFGIIPLPVVYMTILVIVFIILLGKTKFGTYVYALGGNRESARLSGVPIKKIEVLVFTISGLLAAFAGIVLASRMYSGQPTAGDGYEMDAIAAAILGGTSMRGGKGSIIGTIVACFILNVLKNGLTLLSISTHYQEILTGLILIISVLISESHEREKREV